MNKSALELERILILNTLVNGNVSWTSEEILKHLNEAGYYVVKLNGLHKGSCPTCTCRPIEGQKDYTNESNS